MAEGKTPKKVAPPETDSGVEAIPPTAEAVRAKIEQLAAQAQADVRAMGSNYVRQGMMRLERLLAALEGEIEKDEKS